MLKKEIIWRYILTEFFNNRTQSFTQKEIGEKFGFSTSTVFNALKAPRKLGAVEVTGRLFRLRDAEKLLLLWATQRNFKKDIYYETRVDKPCREIEGDMPPDVIFGGMSAYRLAHREEPADYSSVYVYGGDADAIKKRFPKKRGVPNLFILQPDLRLPSFGKTTPDAQTFVDLWNIPDWYAKDYLDALRRKILS